MCIYNIGKLDSGASNYYLKPENSNLLQNIRTAEASHKINLPNNDIIFATKQDQLNLYPALSSAANAALKLRQLTNESSLSIGQLYDNYFTVLY